MLMAGFDIVIFSIYFILLFLSIFWLTVLYTVKDSKKPILKGEPYFTVLVPAYNEEGTILKTLKSLVELDYPENKKQIIVINDGSKDKTQEVIEKFIKNHPLEDITLLNQENQGKGSALNNGLKYTKGKFYACLDADSSVEKNAIKEMLPYFEDREVAAVCPLLKIEKPTTVIEKVQWYEYVVNMFYKYLNAKINCIHVTPGPFSVYRTQLIKDLGGYDTTTITEDLEIAIRLQKHQYKIVQTFDATVYTKAPKTWKGLFKQRVRWYKGSVDNSISYRDMIFNKKYGDFGVIRMPTIILSGILTIILTLFLLRHLLTRLVKDLIWMIQIKFDVIPLIKNIKLDFDILLLPFSKIFIACFLISIGLFVMFYSYRVIGEKITNHGKTFVSLIVYLLMYSLFLSTVWLYIAFIFISGKQAKW
ncbi:hypothetical protein CL616_02730 [archaeon]|nr:hypothetical protein [archaeon]